MGRPTPPKPPSRPEGASAWQRLRLFEADMFRSQPERLYRAWMARMRHPLGMSILANDPEILSTVLEERPQDFPKARGIGAALRPLLGESVFVTNGARWEAQRRIIDPAFAAGRLRENFAPMLAAIDAGVERMPRGRCEVEFEMSHLAADVIFRTLFSMALDAPRARAVFEAFRAYQRAQPLLSPAALLRLPAWLSPAPGRREARVIRGLLRELVDRRMGEIAERRAPDDLATKIMTTKDPATGLGFDADQMADQVAIFFLAGHETSASALGWALYCLALDKEAQEKCAQEAEALGTREWTFADLAALPFTRDVFRETLRLYPPVPMMVREAGKAEVFRETHLRRGALVFLSPWHLGRHERIWDAPDVFDPWRWRREETRASARAGHLPFSKGARVCTGAGFAMMEGTLALARLVKAYRFAPAGEVPRPVAHLTLRAESGIYLEVARRG